MMSRARPVSQLSEDRDFACVFENDGGTTITWDKRTTRCRVRHTISEVTFLVGTHAGGALCVLAPVCSLPRQLHRMLVSRIARSVANLYFFCRGKLAPYVLVHAARCPAAPVTRFLSFPAVSASRSIPQKTAPNVTCGRSHRARKDQAGVTLSHFHPSCCFYCFFSLALAAKTKQNTRRSRKKHGPMGRSRATAAGAWRSARG